MVKAEARVLNIEELLSDMHKNKEVTKKYKNRELIKEYSNREVTNEECTVNTMKQMSKKLPIATIILIILFAALGTMVIALKAEVADFGNLREQIAANDPKFKIAIIEEKLEASEKEKEALKKELAQIKNHIEELKSIKTEEPKNTATDKKGVVKR